MTELAEIKRLRELLVRTAKDAASDATDLEKEIRAALTGLSPMENFSAQLEALVDVYLDKRPDAADEIMAALELKLTAMRQNRENKS